MVLLNVMLVTAFVILLAVAADEVFDTYRLTRQLRARQPQ